jgi:hypothetical protein
VVTPWVLQDIVELFKYYQPGEYRTYVLAIQEILLAYKLMLIAMGIIGV